MAYSHSQCTDVQDGVTGCDIAAKRKKGEEKSLAEEIEKKS